MLHLISETGKSKKIFLRISKGAIISKRNGEVTSFEAISGSIKGIELKEHEFENEVPQLAHPAVGHRKRRGLRHLSQP